MQSWFWRQRFWQAYSRYHHHPTAEHLTDQASLPIQVHLTTGWDQKEISIRVSTDENFECPVHDGSRDLSSSPLTFHLSVPFYCNYGPRWAVISRLKTHVRTRCAHCDYVQWMYIIVHQTQKAFLPSEKFSEVLKKEICRICFWDTYGSKTNEIDRKS